ncbi:hypothetical protein T12_3605 [Trichinella patagoniensis]|uniref:Uncharacterized protein n=1 Tax=Trichinella patagoniensis TaxID=990121 RepID=A0A0V1A8M7_9BILA|nr:hypothetical protein T12_3605 [Trichinella patagoniensis]
MEILFCIIYGKHKDCKEKEAAEPTVKLSFSVTLAEMCDVLCVSGTKTNRSGALVCVQKRKLRFPSASGQSVNVAKVNRIFIAHTKLMNDPL